MTASRDSEFSDLYTEHYPSVLRMMGRYLAVLDAEDAAQTVFLRAWRHWPPPHAETRRWLYKIAATTLVDAMRRRRASRNRMALMEFDMPVEADGYFAADGLEEATLERVVVDARWQAVRRAWGWLSPAERGALREMLAGKTAGEAAQALGITPGAYKTRLHRAKRVLTRAVRAWG